MSNKPGALKRKQKKELEEKEKAMLYEQAMIEGILEGSPEAVGVAVIRLTCGCFKMAAVDENGDPASKVVIFRYRSEKVCELCQKDKGAYERVKEAFIHWEKAPESREKQQEIELKVLGSVPAPASLPH